MGVYSWGLGKGPGDDGEEDRGGGKGGMGDGKGWQAAPFYVISVSYSFLLLSSLSFCFRFLLLICSFLVLVVYVPNLFSVWEDLEIMCWVTCLCISLTFGWLLKGIVRTRSAVCELHPS